MTTTESGASFSGPAGPTFFIASSSDDFQDARVTSPDRTSSEDGKKKPVNTRLYKTNLCRTFSKFGTCPYGMKCQFAHGESELRPVPEDLDDKKKLDAITPVIPIFSTLTPVALRMTTPGALQSTVSAVDPATFSGSKVAAGASVATAPSMTMGGFSFSSSSVEEMQQAAAATRFASADIPFTLADLPILDPGKKLTSMSTASPRVTMLSLGTAFTEKPIPEGARVDCDPKMYKTELCRSFSRTGFCRYGAKCQFAHGLEELRPAPMRMRRAVIDGEVSKETEAEEKAAWEAQDKVNELSVAPGASSTPTLGISSEPKVDVAVATPVAGTDSPVTALRIKDDDAMLEDEEDRWGKIRPESATARLQRTEKSTVSPKVKDPRVYKTELCKKFEATGNCPYGLKCQFAHGKKELRTRIPFTTTAAGAPDVTFPVLPPLSAASPAAATSPTRALSPDGAASSASPTSSSGTDLKLYKTELCRSFTKSGYCRYGLKCQFAHGIQEMRPSPRLVSAAARLGMISVDVASPTVNPLASEFGVLNDSKLTSSSPRRLVGSPVIASPKAKSAGLAGGFSAASSASEVSVPALFGKGSPEVSASSKTDSPRVSVVTEAFSFALPIAPRRSVPLGSEESAISAMSSS